MTKQAPQFHGHRRRLRERFLRSGLEGFAEYEIVELLLTLAIPRSDVKQPAKELLSRFGSLRGILDADSSDLARIPGIGPVTPIALRIVRDAAGLYLRQAAEQRESLAEGDALARFWRMRLQALPREVFEVAYLDSSLRLLRDGVEELERGTVDRAVVYPRVVMESALKRGAAALVVAHNHPDGRAQPSEQDKLVTRALVLAAETLQLRLIDHLIVGGDDVFSFRKAGLL